MQQLSHSTDNTITSMYSFTNHYTLYPSKFLLLLPATHSKLRQSIAHVNVTASPGTGSFACPVQAPINVYCTNSALNIQWLQTANFESNNTGQAPLKHLHSSTDWHIQTNSSTAAVLVLKMLLFPLQQILTIIAHNQEMMLHALAPTHPSTSRLLHQDPECRR